MAVNPKKTIEKIWRPAPDTSKRSNYYRFERNERTTLFSVAEFDDMLSHLSPYDFVAYGELEPFYEKICNWLNIKRENILLTSGADAGIKAIYETYVNKNEEILISLPNYAMYSAYTLMFGGVEVQHLYEKNLTLDLEGFKKKINPKTKLVVLSNPSHTGTTISEKEIVQIIEIAASTESLVLIDEAYHHFSTATMINYINRYQNLIIVRTFSKAFGLASLRMGLLISCKKIIEQLYKVKLVHEIDGVASKIGSYLLDNMQIVDKYVEDINAGKCILYERLNKLNIDFTKSESNFVLFKTPSNINPSNLKHYLKQNRILIGGPFQKFPFDNHLRVTVGDEYQMNLFCDAVEDYLNN